MTTTHSSTKYFWARALTLLIFTVALTSTAAAQQSTKTCKSSADCGPDEACEVTGGSGSTSPGCAPGQTCVIEPTVTMVDYGCVAKPRVCMADSQCPFPLVCSDNVSFGDTVTNNQDPAVSPTPTPTTAGGAPTSMLVAVAPIPSPTPPPNRVCTWKVVACQTNAECGDARLECIEFGRSTQCSGSGGTTTGSSGGGSTTATTPAPRVGANVAASGTEAPVPAPVPSDCKEVVTKACFPKITPCNSSASQCASGQVCHDFSDSPDAPFYVAGTRNFFCIPQGLELALNGKANIDGGAINSGSSGSSEGGAPRDTSFLGGAGKDARSAPSSPPATNDENDAAGCSVGGRALFASAGFWMTLVALCFFVARRRNR
jgi:hypothetical protein